jgi:hypothetical protein
MQEVVERGITVDPEVWRECSRVDDALLGWANQHDLEDYTDAELEEAVNYWVDK